MTQRFLYIIDESSSILIFTFFCLCLWLFGFINSEFVVTDELYNQYVDAQMNEKYGDYDELTAEFGSDLEDSEDTSELLESGLDFVSIIVFNGLKFLIISSFLFVGLTINADFDISFNRIIKIVIASDFIFFLPKIIKSIWLLTFIPNFNFSDVNALNPLSLLAIFEYQDVEEWSIYPLKTINLFEAIYVFLLVYGISFLSNKEKSKFATPIILSYMLFVAMTMALRIYLTSLI